MHVWFISSPLSSIYYILEKQKDELHIQGVIFLTRLASIGIGGAFGDPRLAVILFAVTGVLVYGWLIKILLGYVQVKTKKILLDCLGVCLASLVCLVPVVVVKVLEVSGAGIILVSVLMLILYFFQQRRLLSII